jgi:hypothetical protein
MNLVNLVTSVHRLGKLVSNDVNAQTDLAQDPTFANLCGAIHDHLKAAASKEIQPQTLSNIVWALATARYVDSSLVSVAVKIALPNIASFKYFELSTFLWAVAKLSSFAQDEFIAIPLKDLFEKVANHLVSNNVTLTFRSLSMISWAAATAKQKNFKLMSFAATQMTPRIGEAGNQEMANAMWAFGALGLNHSELFEAIANQAIPGLHTLKAQELSNMLWGMASNGFFHDDFFRHTVKVVTTLGLQPQHCANILWSYARVCGDSALTQSAVFSILPLCLRQLPMFKANELSSVVLSVAKTFGNSFPWDGAYPVMTEFLSFVVPFLIADLGNFGQQSLVSLVRAAAMMGSVRNEDLVVALGEEILKRAPALASSDILYIMEAFVDLALQSSCAGVSTVLQLAAELEGCVHGLRKHEVRALSSIITKVKGSGDSQNYSRFQLREDCRSIAKAHLPKTTMLACETHSLAQFNDEATSVFSTEDLNSNTDDTDSLDSDFSDSAHQPSIQHAASHVWAEICVAKTFVHVRMVDTEEMDRRIQRSLSCPALF